MRVPSPHRAAATIALLVAALALPTVAHAAETYTYRAETCGTNRGHGSNDINGTMYGACGANIVRFSATNKRLANITVGTLKFSSVAVSPNAKFIYASTGGRLVRLDRQADGSYRKNGTWAPKPFTLNDVAYKPVPRNVVTDEFGYIYISNAGKDPDTKLIAPTRILKYAPNGTVMTHFGEHNDEPGNPYAFFQNRGLGVTRDGRSIYVTSHLQGEVRRFDIQSNGEYRYHSTIGHEDTTCGAGGGLAAPSDVAVDPWGYVYVPDTSCRRIKKYSPTGKFIRAIATRGPRQLHEIGVNRRGDVFAGEWNRFYTRTADNPVPGPIPAITKPVIDVTAPVLTRIELPAAVDSPEVQIAVTATDAVGIAEARVANEDGEWGPWQAYANPLPHTLTDGATYKAVYVQVRDAAGNESGVAFTTTLVVEPTPPPTADTTAPVLRSITLPATTATRAIQVDLDATDDTGITHVRFANEDGNWQPWKEWADPAAHTLTTGLTYKVVYAQVRDAAGNESGVTYAVTRLVDAELPPPPAPDTVAPTLTAITLPATTATRTITVGIAATDDQAVAQVRLANEDGNWGAWRDYAPTVQQQLSAGYSIKGVYVQVRDAAGNESAILYRTLVYAAG